MNDIVVEKKSVEVLAAFSKILVLIYIAFITFYCQYKYYFFLFHNIHAQMFPS